jgi:AcrR family transcriptional regulator
MAVPNSPALNESDARQRLLGAAEAEFAENGFKAATVRRMCERAGVNIAAVNYYFGDKERLYAEAVRHAHVCSAAGGPPAIPPDAPPVEKLRAFIREMVKRMHVPASPTSMQLMMREMAHPSAAGREVVRDYIRPIATGLEAILRELMPELDDRRRLMTGFSVIGQILFYRQNRPVAELIFGKDRVDALDVDAVTEHVTRFTLAALGVA